MINQQKLMFSKKHIACELHFKPNAQSVIYRILDTDMENVPSKPSAAQVIVFGSGKFLC